MDPKEWLQQYEQNPTAAMKSLEKKTKTQIRDMLHEVQLQMPEAMVQGGHGKKGPKAPRPREQLLDLLRTRREEPPRRQFLKFTFGNRQAQSMEMRDVLKMPQVVTQHPDPAQAEKITLCENFQPQIHLYLLNYTKLAKTFNIKESLKDTLEKCDCKTCFKYLKPEEIMDSAHVVSADT